MKRLLIGICLIATCGFGQGKAGLPNGNPDNTYGAGHAITTNGTTQLSACVTQGGKPVSEITLQLTSYTTIGSGWHAHDGGSSGRPQAIIGSNPYQITGANGCTPEWTVQIPGYAGWYTFEAYSSTSLDITPDPIGINFYAQAPGSFIQYPNEGYNNISFQGTDGGHSQQIRWFQPSVVNQIESASAEYQEDSTTMLGYFDSLILQRGSLPAGGAMDNDAPFSGDCWDDCLRDYEEHAKGTEVDVVNPSVFSSGGGTPPVPVVTATLDMSLQGCQLGQWVPSFNSSYLMTTQAQMVQYWYAQPLIHYVCGRAPLARSPH